MIKVHSKLENTYIKGVLLKKGENKLSEADYAVISKSLVFKGYISRKFVVVDMPVQSKSVVKSKGNRGNK